MIEERIFGLSLMNECKHQKTPTKEENLELVRRVKANEPGAVDELCLRNGRLVLNQIHERFGYYEKDIEDMFQQGMLGLMRAALEFDFEKDAAFSTYAYFWIRQSIQRYINDTNHTIRIPVHMQEKLIKFFNACKEYRSKHNEDPTVEYLASVLDCSVDNVKEFYRYSTGVISLDSPVLNDEGDTETSIGDYIEDNTYNTEKKASENFLREDIEKILNSCLNDRELYVVKMRTGLYDGCVHTLDEIGKQLNVTRERIRQIEARAFKKLRSPRCRRALKDYAIDLGFNGRSLSYH